MKKFYILWIVMLLISASCFGDDGSDVTNSKESGDNSGFFLRPGEKTFPEPWYAWIGGMDGMTPVQLFTDIPQEEILHVEFFFAYGIEPVEWILFDEDTDGFSFVAPGPSGSLTSEADGWCGYLPHEMIIPDFSELWFKSNIMTAGGETIEVFSEMPLFFDPMPPSAFELNIEDGFITDEDYVSIKLIPEFPNMDYAGFSISEKPEEFQKDIPIVTQPEEDSMSCGPYALAACLKYFANNGYPNIDGGLTPEALAEALKPYVKFDPVKGTRDIDLAAGARKWIEEHGGGFTVTGPSSYSNFNTTRMRDKTEGDALLNGISQNIIPLFQWIVFNPVTGKNDTLGHYMTLSSVHNSPVEGKRKFDFMDPGAGIDEYIYGDIDEATGECSDFDDNYPPNGAKVFSTIMICPNEPAPIPEGGSTVVSGPEFPPVDMPLPDSGKTIIRTRAVNTSGHKSERDIVITRVPKASCPDTIVQAGSPPFIPQGGYPSGGSFSGPGFQDGWFYPIDEGTYNVTYAYTYENGFTSTGSFIIRVVAFDFGDAPDDPYPTLLANDGARHAIDGFTFLGNLIDGEPDGQPNTNATGDDFNNRFDEDGVTFVSPLVAGKTTQIRVQASTAGFLNVWIDLNQNGNWGDPGDQIFTDQPLNAGFNALTFHIPASAKAGETYLRFRFNTNGGLSFFGPAENGEVEDYKINVYPEGWDYTPTGSSHIISVPLDVSLHCINLSAGDFIGAFYLDDDGNEACGGATFWDGISNKTLVAFGDDITTTTKEGFAEGEELILKLFENSTGTEKEMVAVFDPALPHSDGKFYDNGISALLDVSEKLVVSAFADPMSVCVGESVNLQATINHNCGNPQFSWSSNPAGFIASQQNTSDSPEVTTTYTVNVTNSFGDTASAMVTVVVFPLPMVDCPEDFTICGDTEPFLLSGGTPAGGIYSGMGVIVSGSDFIFDPAMAGAGNHTITYSYVDPQTGCENFCTFVISVIEVPEVTCPEDLELCIDAGSKVLTGGTPTGGIYSGSGVQFGSIFYPTLAGVGSHIITYTYSVPGSNCTASCEFVITVHPLPQVDCPADMEICYLTPTLPLMDANPLGGVYSGEGVFFEGGSYYFDPSVGLGVYEIEYCYTDANGCIACCTFHITVKTNQIIEIPTGWSGISSYIHPDNPELNSLLYPITYPLILLSNFEGIYWPGGNTFTLENWDVYSGYVIKSEWDTQLPFCGSELPDKTVELSQGWNLIPVLSDSEHDIEALFAGVEGFELAKEIAGMGVYWDEFGINSIGNVIPGKAYYVKMNAGGSVTFDSKSATLPSKNKIAVPETPWNDVTTTPGSHVVVFNTVDFAFETGDVIGGFTESAYCAGVAQVEELGTSFTISLHADDFTTAEKTGFDTGEKMQFKLYRPQTDEVFDLKVSYNPGRNTGTFEANGISEITGVKMAPTSMVDLTANDVSIFPNPTTGTFIIKGVEKPMKVIITDSFGKLIFEKTGMQEQTIDLSDQPRGVYFIQIETAQNTFVQKLILQ